jgi:hypothetical protein
LSSRKGNTVGAKADEPRPREIRDDPECPGCKRTMRLVGIERHPDNPNAELLTFE